MDMETRPSTPPRPWGDSFSQQWHFASWSGTSYRADHNLRHKKTTEAYGPALGLTAPETSGGEREELGDHEMKSRREAGTLRRIADWLNASGAPTKKGGRWYASTVSYVLQNALYS